MKLAVVLHASNKEDRRFKNVEYSLKKHKLDYFVYGDKVWKGFGEKIHTIYKACKELTDYTHVLFIDAYDVIVLGDSDDILKRFISLKSPIIFSAEVNCWSGGVDEIRASKHPVCNTPWKYLNSGSYMADRKFLLYFLEPFNIKNIPNHTDDQRFFMDCFLENTNSIKLDTNCVLFQSLLGGMHLFEIKPNYFKNTLTNTHPLILHHNGGADIETLKYLWE